LCFDVLVLVLVILVVQVFRLYLVAWICGLTLDKLEAILGMIVGHL